MDISLTAYREIVIRHAQTLKSWGIAYIPFSYDRHHPQFSVLHYNSVGVSAITEPAHIQGYIHCQPFLYLDMTEAISVLSRDKLTEDGYTIT